MASRGKTPFQLHVETWKDCNECPLCETRLHVVLARGSIPADIVFLGEAPGKTEDIIGAPFVGEAGKLLDEIIEEAIDSKTYTYALTNLIACAPFDEDNKLTDEGPPEESVIACMPRLVEFVELANPRLIVCVGKHAEWWTDPGYKKRIKFHDEDIPRVCIVHPASILYNSMAMRTLTVRRCIVQIQNAIKEYLTCSV